MGIVLFGAALLAACTSPPSNRVPERSGPSTPPASVVPAPLVAPLTLDGYKRAFAERVVLASGATFQDPLPEVLKSIVVLDITIDREGRLAGVAVRRSNGYKALENTAIDGVKRAAPFGAPSPMVRRGDGSVNFLETFLFRDDGCFQVLSLVR